jgi:RNA polymerase sigma factor (sigma-70 family)
MYGQPYKLDYVVSPSELFPISREQRSGRRDDARPSRAPTSLTQKDIVNMQESSGIPPARPMRKTRGRHVSQSEALEPRGMWEMAFRLARNSSMAVDDARDAASAICDGVLERMKRDDAFVHTAPAVMNFIAACVRNLSTNLQSKRRVRDEAEARLTEDVEINAPLQVDPLLAVERAERRAEVRRAIQRQPKERRRISTMYWLEGMTQPQIAAVLGKSVRTIEKQIALAHKDLRKALKHHAPEGRNAKNNRLSNEETV